MSKYYLNLNQRLRLYVHAYVRTYDKIFDQEIYSGAADFERANVYLSNIILAFRNLLKNAK